MINEFVNTCYRKNLLPAAEIRNAVEDFLSFFELTIIQESTIITALDIKERYSISWYDALIVGAALENECSILFSEDMQDGIVIIQKLAVKNPFLK